MRLGSNGARRSGRLLQAPTYYTADRDMTCSAGEAKFPPAPDVGARNWQWRSIKRKFRTPGNPHFRDKDPLIPQRPPNSRRTP